MSNDISAQPAPSVSTAMPDDDTQIIPAAIDLDDPIDEPDPFTDDLSSELDAAASKTWRNRATVAMIALAILVAGFLGGVLTQKNFGKAPAASAATRGIGGAGGFAGGFARGGGTAGGRGAGAQSGAGPSSGASSASQTGVIKLVDGNTIYVQMPNGDVLTVRTNGSTKVSLASTAKVASLKKGQQVTFAGPTDSSSGTVTATSVTASPATSR